MCASWVLPFVTSLTERSVYFLHDYSDLLLFLTRLCHLLDLCICMMMCVAQFFLGAISGGFWLNAGCEVFIGRITNLLSLKRTLGHVRGLYYAIFYF